MMAREVFFFANGNTAHFDGQEQVPELQVSWLGLYLEFLEAHGVDPEGVTFNLPAGRKAVPFRTEYGWNWTVE